MTAPLKQSAASAPPLLHVSFETMPGARQEFQFDRTFRIGRVEECDVCIKNDYVSRSHVEVAFESGQWRFRDLGSSNGVFIDGQRVEGGEVNPATVIRLGIGGPHVSLKADAPKPAAAPKPEADVAHYIDHYFSPKSGEPAGDHTIMVRQAFSKVQKKQRWRYGWVIGVVALMAVGAGTYALFLHQQASKQKALAENLFYSMKSLDLDIANVEKLVINSGSQQGQAEIHKYQNRRKDMEKNYDQFLSALHVYDAKITPQQRLIMRVARIFGECELAMPADFESEINVYIQKWKGSGRLARALKLAQANGYTTKIAQDFLDNDLPPQFFYLALQESDFDQFISGPMTRKGIAKGMWQFIPETAVKYGLHIGPLADLRRPDPGDDRHHWDRATHAAVSYIKDLYSTDAQASGFLVMACYNWGEGYVLPLVQKMPANPKDRNFWKLLSVYKDKFPKETYDYVFYIVSAAVIGENPRLFGFDFDNPLAQLESK